MPTHDFGDALRDRGRGPGDEAPVGVLIREAMAAEVDHRWAGEDGENAGVEAHQLTDQSQLPPGRREGAVVTLMAGGCKFKRGAGAVHVAEQQPRLSHRGGGVIVSRRLTDHLERTLGPLPRQRALPGDERQRRRIDERVVAAGSREHLVVELGRMGGLTAPRRSVAAERDVLGDPGAQRGDVLVGVRDGAQAVQLEMPGGLLGCAGASEREHGPVLEADVVRVLGKAALGEVERGQQFAAAFLAAYRLQPPSCCLCLRRPAHGSIVRSAHGRHSSQPDASAPPPTPRSDGERSAQRIRPRRDAGDRDRTVG